MANGKKGRVLIVEDDLSERRGLSDLLAAWGYETETAADGEDALGKIASFEPHVVISDLRMPRMTGMELLKRMREEWPGTALMMLTGQATIEEAVEATKLGALNFIEKPIEPARLQVELRNCLDRQDNVRQLEIANRRLRDAGLLGSLVGRSKRMQDVMALIEQVAPSSASVLITGESGTGKELAARTIHELSPRAARAFVAVNCAAIPETLMESEIFGHEKGAFTGATERRLGCFELADTGTLLLDEIGEMPMQTQAKLLRVLEDSRVRRLGSKHEISVDVRVLAATNKVPEEAVAKGQLRNDLYFRLNVVQIEMPPLREHLEDLDDMVAAILADLGRKHGREVKEVDSEVLEAFRHYSWPGNVRELRNSLERGVVVCTNGVLRRKDLSAEFGRTALASDDGLRLRPGLTVGEAERRLIMETLAFAGNNKTRAAQMLGISLKTLHNKLKQYETQPQS
ncbi:MAG TPA: sigma-54 dependent transcriptional regulator [Terriglobia bacterium]|jgi:DNA-binding NtrC family response regulator|nr:sigma-54 dependent transcriptional regulator [Terriglobia bacterium]